MSCFTFYWTYLALSGLRSDSSRDAQPLFIFFLKNSSTFRPWFKLFDVREAGQLARTRPLFPVWPKERRSIRGTALIYNQKEWLLPCRRNSSRYRVRLTSGCWLEIIRILLVGKMKFDWTIGSSDCTFVSLLFSWYKKKWKNKQRKAKNGSDRRCGIWFGGKLHCVDTKRRNASASPVEKRPKPGSRFKKPLIFVFLNNNNRSIRRTVGWTRCQNIYRFRKRGSGEPVTPSALLAQTLLLFLWLLWLLVWFVKFEVFNFPNGLASPFKVDLFQLKGSTQVDLKVKNSFL